MSAPRAYATWLIAAVVGVSVAAFILNTRVNPWRVTPVPWADDQLDAYRDVSSQIRTAKAGMVRSAGELGVGFFGSSRVANAFDPTDPRWGRDDVLNLGCSGGFLYESTAMCRYAMRHHALEIAILGVDPGDLSSDLDTRPMGDFYASPLASRQDPDRELRYLIGISTAEASLETLKRSWKGVLPQYAPGGQRVRSRKARGKPQIAFIREQITGEAEFGMLADGRGAATVREEKAVLVEDLALEARRRGTRLILLFHPTHALRHLRATDATDPPVLFENERRRLLAIVDRANAAGGGGPPVEFWDFLDAHPLNDDPLPEGDGMMEHWTDLDHYTDEVGGIIQARVMGWKCAAPDYGTRVTARNLDAWFERVRHSCGQYVATTGREDIRWKEALIESSVGHP
ncbi:hypothetical protein [Haloferula sargassicola]|uniref:SGNH/GDSL hydrolase family protein n=1 Tax=Haloferula sargassicola TaxID=490096 RepID=A0ABP9UJM9_9BACT